ncbi:unnamed protein product [marine sediment metagenome]|uniref:Uncharacterized protein n=1 Tax=marine sediment metagenome TaxID=412755 RepID=X0WZT8_9ZZZZ
MNTFLIPKDLLNNKHVDTESDTVRVNVSNGYIEFTVMNDYVEVRCMGRDCPVITFQTVMANSATLFIEKSIERKANGTT